MPESKQNASSRNVGRPLDSDSESMRLEILDAAEKYFSEQGYTATSIRQIADEVGVNPAMVHYYFGKKPLLLNAVFERALEPLASSIASFKSDQSATLSDFCGIFIEMASLHPNLPKLVTREVLLPGGQMREVFIEKFAFRLGGVLPEFVSAQQQEGKLSEDFDPAAVTLSVLSLCIFPFVAQELIVEVLKLDLAKEETLQAWTQQLHQLIHRGLTP